MLLQILQTIKPVIPYYDAIVQKKLIVGSIGEDGGFGFRPNIPALIKATEGERQFVKKLFTDGTSALISSYVLAHMISNGPKVFNPKAENIEALANMTLNVSFDDYEQPFETIVIQFPEEYQKKYIVRNPITGVMPSGFFAGEYHEPKYVVTHHLKEARMLIVCIQYSSSSIYSILMNFRDGKTIEEVINTALDHPMFGKSLEITQEETEISKQVLRITLNCVLAMEEFGIQRIGPANPSHYNRLERRISGKHGEAARSEHAKHPIIYSFDQNIKLYDEYRTPTVSSGHTERGETAPHWRCGHYRMQHYGHGNELVKRIRIKPVLVNRHLFAGNASDTTYRKSV